MAGGLPSYIDLSYLTHLVVVVEFQESDGSLCGHLQASGLEIMFQKLSMIHLGVSDWLAASSSSGVSVTRTSGIGQTDENIYSRPSPQAFEQRRSETPNSRHKKFVLLLRDQNLVKVIAPRINDDNPTQPQPQRQTPPSQSDHMRHQPHDSSTS